MNASCYGIILSLVACGFGNSFGVYVYNGDPYVIGPLSTGHIVVTKTYDGSPEHMSVYFPEVPGIYVPIVFVSGFKGFLPSELYSDVLEQLARHGYIVVGVDLYYPVYSTKYNTQATNANMIGKEPDQMYKVVDWLQTNLKDTLTTHGFPDVTADWDLLGFASHSAGGDTVLKIIENNNTIAKAVAFIEPLSFDFSKPLNYSLPTLSFGTEWSEENVVKCMIPGFDFKHFYKMLQCPKIMMNATNYGHCDILDEESWKVCHDIHFCKTSNTNDRTFYHTFVSGIMTALFGTYLQGNSRLLPYISEPKNIPVSLGEFQADLNCTLMNN